MSSTALTRLIFLILSLLPLAHRAALGKGAGMLLKGLARNGKMLREDMPMFNKVVFDQAGLNGRGGRGGGHMAEFGEGAGRGGRGRPNEFMNEYGENFYEARSNWLAENQGLRGGPKENLMKAEMKNIEFQFKNMELTNKNLRDMGKGAKAEAELGELNIGRNKGNDLLMNNARDADLFKAEFFKDVNLGKGPKPEGPTGGPKGNVGAPKGNVLPEVEAKGNTNPQGQPKGNIGEVIETKAGENAKQKVNFQVGTNLGRGNGPKAENLPAEVKGQNLPAEIKGQNLPAEIKGQNLPAEIKGQNLPAEIKGGKTDLVVKEQPKGGNLPMVIEPQAKDIVVREQGNLPAEIKAEPKDVILTQNQHVEIIEVGKGNNLPAEIKPQNTDLMVVKEGPKDLVVQPKQGGNLPVAQPQVVDLALWVPKEEMMAKVLKAPNGNPFGNFGRSPMFAGRPFVNVMPELGNIGELGKGGRSDAINEILMGDNAQTFDPHIQTGIRRGMNLGQRLPGKGKWLDVFEDKALGVANGAKTPIMATTTAQTPIIPFNSPLFFNPFFYHTNMAMIMKHLKEAEKAKTKTVLGYTLNDEEFGKFAQTYTGVKAQINTQFNLAEDITLATDSFVTDLKNKPVTTPFEIFETIKNISPENAYNHFKENGLAMTHSTEVHAKTNFYIYDELNGEDDPQKLLWNRIFNENKFLENNEPISKFKKIFYDPTAEKDEMKRMSNMQRETSQKGLYNARLEYLMTPVPMTYDYDILLDLPMYNYVLNIEEQCIEDFAVEICDDIVNDLHTAYTKFGPIIRRNYDFIEGLSGMVIKKRDPAVLQKLVDNNVLPTFKNFSQHMFNRLEFLLLSYVPARK